jgi:hypothetical protein
VFATGTVVPGAGGTNLEIGIGRVMLRWRPWLVMGVLAPAAFFGSVFAGFLLQISPLLATLAAVGALVVVIVGYQSFAKITGARWTERMQASLGRLDAALKALPNSPTYRG